ncbi:unnamed protein product [Eruca vesicaria subsp. sativa]|uniref:Uncharacterized protein n=1 Tax=Eruca vesicaria subsp. sativa TaxID=29727 RepID=A0ABC8M0C4_ERUVS|nr:unnamed protein product [Eruca vesicaria subsp. sativa]
MKVLGAFGHAFSAKKFKKLLYDARSGFENSRSAVEDKISDDTSVVTTLLREGDHKKAYNKVHIVIRKQNQVDAYNIIIGYLGLLIEDIDEIKPKRDIPEEHIEAVSSLIFAAPRIRLACTCFTVLQVVRKTFLLHFGKNLAAQYLEINDCRINPQLIEKLSEKRLLKEVKMKVLEEIAAKENIVLKLEEASTSTEGTSDKAELASEETVEDETRKGCGLSDPGKSEKKKQVDLADPDKAVANSSKDPENKQPGQGKKGNNNGLAKRGNMKQKGKKKQTGVTEKALVNSSNVTDVAGQEVGSSSNSCKNKKSGQEGNGDSSAKKGTMKQNDVAERALANSSDGPENKESEQDGDDDGLVKRGKKRPTVLVGKAVGSPSNGPENEKSEQEQEGNDVRSESERLVVSDSGEIIQPDNEDRRGKDIDIDRNVEESGDVNHMVHLVGATVALLIVFVFLSFFFIKSS